MLASDGDGSIPGAPPPSAAGDLVEIAVLTTDQPFLDTLRTAVDPARRVWQVAAPDKVSDLLVAGSVGILVIDLPAVGADAPRFITQIKHQFPDLVVLVAGDRASEAEMLPQITTAEVFRFIHKPVSPGRAKLFADAAVRKHGERRLRRHEGLPPRRRAKDGEHGARRRWIIAAGVGGCALAAAGTVWLVHPTDGPKTPAPAATHAASAETREQLLARAEQALLEEHVDEAQTAITAARGAGVETGRIDFLTAELAKLRRRNEASRLDVTRPRESAPLPAHPADAARGAAAAAQPGPSPPAVTEVAEAGPDQRLRLAARLLGEAHGAIERGDLDRAAGWLDAATGVASPASLEALRQALAAARLKNGADSRSRLVSNLDDRLRQDRLIEPPGDSAEYYFQTLEAQDPANPRLTTALPDLGARLVAKARQAIGAEQFDAARQWLAAANRIGYGSADASAAAQDLAAALGRQQFLADIVSAKTLTVLKSVTPVFPERAERDRTQGWVELDFTVDTHGEVKDIVVHAAEPPGVFDQAALRALAQFRYQPVLRDSTPVPQRARIRIRFSS